MEYPSFENKSKKRTLLLVMCLLFGAWIAYTLWAGRIVMRTVLMPSIPEWTTYIVIGCLVGLFFAARATYYRPAVRNPNRVGESFFGGFCLGLILSLHSYDVVTYLLPGDIVQYASPYELVTPGPYVGKFSRCEAGLRIKDLKTERWVALCTTQSEFNDQRKTGMNAVWVTAHSNQIGSYIEAYEFIYK